jgi:hypothetical protein
MMRSGLLEAQTFAPNGASHCENLQLGLRLYRTAEQHRVDCHENVAAHELTLGVASVPAH